MHSVDPAWWCPRCGTLKINNKPDSSGTYVPWLVERVKNYFEEPSEERREVARAAIEESLGDEHREHCVRNVEAGEAGTGPSVDQG
jgi:hypothetical protein